MFACDAMHNCSHVSIILYNFDILDRYSTRDGMDYFSVYQIIL